MILKEIAERVQYPDETEYIVWDGVPYDYIVEDLKASIEILQGQLKTDFQETLDEIQRRWEARQNISSIHVVDTSSALNRPQP